MIPGEKPFNASLYIMADTQGLFSPKNFKLMEEYGQRGYAQEVSPKEFSQLAAIDEAEQQFILSWAKGDEAYRQKVTEWMQRLVNNPTLQKYYDCRGLTRMPLTRIIKMKETHPLRTHQYGFAMEQYRAVKGVGNSPAIRVDIPVHPSELGRRNTIVDKIVSEAQGVAHDIQHRGETITGWKQEKEEQRPFLVSRLLWDSGPNILPSLQHPEEYRSIPIVIPHPVTPNWYTISGFQIIHELTSVQKQNVLDLVAIRGKNF